MKRFALILTVLALFGADAIQAQSSMSSVIGKVLDTDGKPVPDAELTAVNKVFGDRVLKGTSDKKGNVTVNGLLYSETAQEWTLSVKAAGYVPVSAHVVARSANKTLYFEDTTKLSAAAPTIDFKVKAFAEIRVEITMRPGEPEEETSLAPIPTSPGGEGAPGEVAAAGAVSGAYAQAIERVRAGDPEGSVDLFKTAIEEKPDDWERRDVFAKVLLKLDRQGEATIQANKAAQIAPDKAGPYITLTDIYIARGLPDKAAGAIATAQQLEPDNIKVLERAALVDADAGRIDEAIALNEKVLATQPNDTEVMVALADLYNRNKQPKKAEEILNKVVALDPKNAYRTFYNLGVVIENRDETTDADHRKAIEAFRKAIELKPDYPLAHRDLGFAYLRAGSLGDARKELQKYVDLDPQARDAADIKATIKSLASSK